MARSVSAQILAIEGRYVTLRLSEKSDEYYQTAEQL